MAQMPRFSSRLATVLTMIGVAVGLGNVWRFPYMMGKYGGSAFLFVYLIFTILFALPALMGEIAFGRISRKGPIAAFKQAFGTTVGGGIGYLLLFTILVASSYYVIVIANVLFSAYYCLSNGFQAENLDTYAQQLGNGNIQYTIAVISLIASLFILHRGLNKGIEWVSKIFIPFFLIVIIYLIINAFSFEGAGKHFRNFLNPDFASLKLTHVFAALGQAFYSLSLGGTFMLMYGSYLKSEEKIPRIALFTSFGDVGAALLASLFIVPTVLVFGLDLTSGPQLIFSTLPRLFMEMPAGQWIGFFFLLALSFVALLSLIAALEVATGSLNDVLPSNWTRTHIIILIGIIELFLSFPSAFDPALIGILDLIFGSGMQVLGSGLALFALTWGLGKVSTLQEIFKNSNSFWPIAYFNWIKWVVPLILLIVLIGYIYSSI